MCGRFALSAPAENIRSHFGLAEEVVAVPRYNISPTQDIAVVRERNKGGRELVMVRWGLVPSWSGERKTRFSMINARAESVSEKPSFRSSFRKHRCLIPANGFYEWKKERGGSGKQPYFIRMKDGGIFAFAGIWSLWRDREHDEILESCAIITTVPNALVAKIHDRMPVIMPSSQYARWLSGLSPEDDLRELLGPFDPSVMECHPVSPLCNSPVNDSPECVRRIPG